MKQDTINETLKHNKFKLIFCWTYILFKIGRLELVEMVKLLNKLLERSIVV
jgi:hypothetical protein